MSPPTARTRAELLDEGLEILTGLWSGEPFRYEGRHHRGEEMTFLPGALQRPRIPIWVVGVWPRERSMARASRYDGVLPAKQGPDGSLDAELTPTDIRAIRAWIQDRRPDARAFDIVIEGETPAADRTAAAARVHLFAEAGATWWLEGMWSAMQEPERVRERIVAGPPRAVV
ncbi:hypothetical protein BH20CHL6_BH20CHL6_19580 [soil metagenome]